MEMEEVQSLVSMYDKMNPCRLSNRPFRHVLKPIEMVCCVPGQRYTIVQRQLLSVICHWNRSQGDRSQDCIELDRRQLMELTCTNEPGLPSLYKGVAELNRKRAFLNPFDLDSPMVTSRIFTDASVHKGTLRVQLSVQMMQAIWSSKRFALIDFDAVDRTDGFNDLALYEICSAFQFEGQTPWLPRARWSQLIRGHQGRSEQSMQRYDPLPGLVRFLQRSRVLELTLEESQVGPYAGFARIKVGGNSPDDDSDLGANPSAGN